MTFVISDGALAAIGQDITPFGFPMRRGVAISDRISLTYGQIYRTQPAVRMVVDFLARNVASLACQTFERASITDRKRLGMDVSPLAYMLEFSANPTMTGYRLMHSMISDRCIYDAAFWLKVRPGGIGSKTAPGYLRRIPPSRVAPVGGNWFEVDAYRIYGTKGFLDVPASDMVAFPGYSPEDTRNGCSPIESLRSILAEEYAATEGRRQLWDNGLQTAGQVTRPVDAPEWSDTARTRFETDLAAYRTSGPKAGSVPVFEDGMEWKAAGMTPKEAQYIESRKLTREEVASEYHVPGPLVGILDHATFSNIDEQHIQLYVDTLGAWTVSSEGEINTQLVTDFYDPKQVYVEFNINAKLKGDFEQQADQLQSAVGGPYMTRNEARGRINLPAVEGGDELITPLNVVTGGQANPQDSAPPKSVARKAAAPADDVERHVSTLAATFERQRKSVMGRYANGKSAAASTKAEVHDLYDKTRFDAELGADLLAVAVPLAAIVGSSTAKGLASEYDPSETTNYLTAQTAGVAGSINLVTQNALGLALLSHDIEAALIAVFVNAIAQRALSAGRAQATAVAGWASTEAGRQSGTGATKRWVAGAHPRESHAAMSGQTVPLDSKFSNGARWPADAVNLDVDDVAGCNCSLDIIPEGAE